MDKEQNEKLIKEFSPQFIANGIAGLFSSGEYESVKIELTFTKKRAANSGAAANVPPTAPCCKG